MRGRRHRQERLKSTRRSRKQHGALPLWSRPPGSSARPTRPCPRARRGTSWRRRRPVCFVFVCLCVCVCVCALRDCGIGAREGMERSTNDNPPPPSPPPPPLCTFESPAIVLRIALAPWRSTTTRTPRSSRVSARASRSPRPRARSPGTRPSRSCVVGVRCCWMGQGLCCVCCQHHGTRVCVWQMQLSCRLLFCQWDREGRQPPARRQAAAVHTAPPRTRSPAQISTRGPALTKAPAARSSTSARPFCVTLTAWR